MKKSFQQGRYIVLSRLGVGGIASVWRVLDTKYEIERAIKVLQLEHMSESDFQNTSNSSRRFSREATVMMRLHHQNIITVFDSFEEDDSLCIVMEKCVASLDQWIADNGAMSVGLAVQVMVSVLNGLQNAHTKGVVHRDVKPHNILISELGDIKLTDFGLALTSFASHSITKTNAVLGSIQFMSPEQRKNAKNIASSTDIYSCAMTLAYLLEGYSVDDLYLPETLSYLRGKYPDAVVDIIAKAGQKNPEERYTAIDMAKALKIALPSLPQSSESLMNVSLLETFLEDIELPIVPKENEVSQNISTVVVPNSMYGLMGVILLLLLVIAGRILLQPTVSASTSTDVVLDAVEEVDFPQCKNIGSGFQSRLVFGPRESFNARFWDLDQDGMNDAVFSNKLDNSLSVYWGNPEFTFEKAQEIPFQRVDFMPIFSDVNHDGVLDIIGLNTANNRITVYKGLGNREFRPLRKGQAEDMYQDPTPLLGAVHDMNGDGWEDLLFTANPKIESGKWSLLYRENSQRGLDYELQDLPDAEEETFNWHTRLYDFSHPIEIGLGAPNLYWVEDDKLWMQSILEGRVFSKKEVVLEGLQDGQIVKISTLGTEADHVILNHKNDVIMWSAQEGACTLLSNYREGALRDVGYWNDDEYLDFLFSLTCSYCESNHYLWLGQP